MARQIKTSKQQTKTKQNMSLAVKKKLAKRIEANVNCCDRARCDKNVGVDLAKHGEAANYKLY